MKKLQKKCPRCEEKHLEQAVACSYCGLVFSRMELATNAAAKKIIKLGKKDKVVYVKKVPKDLKKWKLVLLTIFTGLFGGHYFYVGRYAKAVTFSILGCFFLTGAILSINSLSKGGAVYFFGIITGFLSIGWLMDIIDVIFNRFKIPVYIDTEV